MGSFSTHPGYLRRWVRAAYLHRLARLEDPFERDGPGGPAVVFAPHPDDEVLGCGGTILRKTAAGAEVGIVFMTDGSSIHSKKISSQELAVIREQEAVAAGKVLGVGEDRITFLRFRDAHLKEHIAEAARCAADVLRQRKPAEVYIPHSKEDPADHRAANQAVRIALSQAGVETVVYEYPVWLWLQWPWVPLRQRTKRMTQRAVSITIASGMGTPVWRELNRAVHIGEVKELKRAALDQHRSQMVKPEGDSTWPVLGEIARGEFLECFFQEQEIFRAYRLPSR